MTVTSNNERGASLIYFIAAVFVMVIGVSLLYKYSRSRYAPRVNTPSISNPVLVPYSQTQKETAEDVPSGNLALLAFGPTPTGFAIHKHIGGKNSMSDNISIGIERGIVSTVVVEVWNYDVYDYENSPVAKKQEQKSQLGEISFLGKKYQVYFIEETSELPATSYDPCSRSSVRKTHFFVTENDISVLIHEDFSSSNCNGKIIEDFTLNKDQMKQVVAILESIKLKE